MTADSAIERARLMTEAEIEQAVANAKRAMEEGGPKLPWVPGKATAEDLDKAAFRKPLGKDGKWYPTYDGKPPFTFEIIAAETVRLNKEWNKAAREAQRRGEKLEKGKLDWADVGLAEQIAKQKGEQEKAAMKSDEGDGKVVRLPARPDEGPSPPPFSDEDLALRFAQAHANDLRFVAEWNKWLAWDGQRWAADKKLAVVSRSRLLCREVASQCNKSSMKKSIASAKTVMAVVTLARADHRLAATVEQWDADPMLINTPDGTVDLRTGALRPHHREDHLTKMTAVGPRGDCPLFLKFLDRITKDPETGAANPEIVAYVNRFFGYCLTGLTNEHVLLFAWGTGANGKSTLFSTVSGLMGEYHRAAPMTAFVASKGGSERHPTEIAGLRGARLVTATETEKGRRWDEAKLKALTGGDIVSARLMRENFSDFTPTFKLAVAGNHKPTLGSVDEAIRRRLHLLPFAVTMPAKERDRNLTDKLKAEWAGILAWLIEGCREWQAHGLNPPKTVIEATDAYLLDQDAVAAWLDECCEIDKNFFSSRTALYKSWKAHAERTGEFAGTANNFYQALDAKKFKRHRTPKARGYQGLRLKPDDPDLPL
jgi:putative DNA primase/helicase